MYEVIFLWALALAYIIFAVVQDLKTREISDWLNFSLVIFALGFRFLYFLFEGDSSFFINGLLGYCIFWIIGNVFYYSKIFAGGDAKLMIALGAILPIELTFINNLNAFLEFILIFLITGFIYILVSSAFLCFRNIKNFKREFLDQFKKNKRLLMVTTGVSIIFLALAFLESLFFALGLLIFLTPYLYIYSKSIDEVCMVKEIQSKNLTEGDWLYQNVKIGDKLIKSKWEGLSKEEIKQILKRYKKVKIRQGVPFSPVFLISFVVFILFTIFNINLWNSFW